MVRRALEVLLDALAIGLPEVSTEVEDSIRLAAMVLCQRSMGPDYGGQAVESWYDANGVWLRNSTDCVSQNYGYPWYDVYGP